MRDSYARKQLMADYELTLQTLDEMVRKSYSKWIQSLDIQFIKKLEVPLIVRSLDGTGRLNVNFDQWVTAQLNLDLKSSFLRSFGSKGHL